MNRGEIMNKWIKFLCASIVLFGSLTPAYAEDSAKVAVGASNDDAQVEELISTFALPGITKDSVIKIDGVKTNQYLSDGSNESTQIFSSTAVEFKNAGYGVQVTILTPDKITKVTQEMYQNAAIAAGAKNADIKIASIVPVTGEGALAGVYEIFASSGVKLDSVSIQNAESQIKLEQTLVETTTLQPTQISKLVTTLNLEIVKAVKGKNELSKEEVAKILDKILSDNGWDLQDAAKELVIEHGVNFSKTTVAKDPETQKILEETLGKYEKITKLYGEPIKVKNGEITITNIKILQPGEGANFMDKPLFSIWYSFRLDEKAKPMTSMIAWIEGVKVVQDNNPNTTNELMLGALPDTAFLNSQMDEIKPGGTVEYAVGYPITDLETPITLNFYKQGRNDFSNPNPSTTMKVEMSTLGN